MYHILIIDDEPEQLLAHKIFLQTKECQVDFGQNLSLTFSFLKKHTYDLILLDVNMPETNGFDLCTKLLSLTSTPIIFLSGLAEEENQLAGFSAGGTDYILKNTSLELFWAKIQARLLTSAQTVSMRTFPPLTLDLMRQRAYINGQNLFLTQTEFSLLALLSSHPGKIWSIENLYRELWTSNGTVNTTLVQMPLSRMRNKIKEAFPQHEFIETVWGKGYQFVPKEETIPKDEATY